MTIGEWVREGKLLTVHTPDLLSRSNEEPGSGLNRMGGRAGYRQRESFMGSDELGSRSMGSFGWAASIGRLREGEYNLLPSEERRAHFLSLVRIATR
jgi:hypothetical protein